MVTSTLPRLAASIAWAVAAITLAGCTIYASDDDSDGDWDDDRPRVRATGGGSAEAPGSLPASLAGREVVIHLRRDALGMSGTGPIGLNVDGPVREDVSISGVYRGREGDWLRLEREGGRMLYIPSGQVLAVEALAGAAAGP